MQPYFRPLLQSGPVRPRGAMSLAGGWTWFTDVEVLERGRPSQVIPAMDAPPAVLTTLTRERVSIAGLDFNKPRVMGILNVTPDSFSDGGTHHSVADALAGAAQMVGVDLLDVGGESTRPGAQLVPALEEIERTAPVIQALRQAGHAMAISIDTRKTPVAEAAIDAGATLVNDVSGFTFDADLAPLCAARQVPVCVMHAQGDPATMQARPEYDDVLLDVYDFLALQIDRLVQIGVPRDQIIADPGIGFGKTLEHNLRLLSHLSLFHALGVPILLGASRKKFIGTLGGAEKARDRMPGSLAVALAALKHGTQIVRVHDVPQTLQAIALWRAVVAGHGHG
ncbi:dihydropteroate synthase [Roseobacter litoralis]|uniref:dihydropteroate synthase n=1 Tax=Roseobacter litoralis TaxID=42443 RepID=UPI0024925BED|nr:dihydropteroate synthase [Roseobacter litoralis]